MAKVKGRSGCGNGGRAAGQGCAPTQDQQDRAGPEHQAEKECTRGFRRGSCKGEELYPFPNKSESVDQPQEKQSQSNAAGGKP